MAFVVAVPRMASATRVIHTVSAKGCVPSGTSFTCDLPGGLESNGYIFSSAVTTVYFDFIVASASAGTGLYLYRSSLSGSTSSDYLNYHYPPYTTFPQSIDYGLNPVNMRANASQWDYAYTLFVGNSNVTPIGVTADINL